MALYALQHRVEIFDEMGLGAQQHSSYQVGGGDTRGTFHDLEAACFFDESVTVLPIAVRSDIIAVYNVLGTVVGDPGKRCHVRRMWD